ncbi:MAG: TauD/TfdA dioxygenase family protein [Acidimicrobiales bacterium]
MHVEPAASTLGATVTDFAATELSDSDFEDLYSAWLEHAVLIMPSQGLSNDEHRSFTRRFGRLERGISRSTTTGFAAISNVTAEGSVAEPESLQARFLVGNTGWHTDSSYKRVSAKASMLASHVAPSSGGDTEWADMRAAHDALSAEDLRGLDGAVAVHSYRYSHAPFGGLEVASEHDLGFLPDVQHPVLRTHPETGRRVLFVGRHASHLIGENFDESRALLQRLTSEGAQQPRLLKHHWNAGDLVIWDNRAVLHRGHPWPEGEARHMVRTTVAGDDPDNEWAAPDELQSAT